MDTVPFVTQSAELATRGIPCMFSGMECMTGANCPEIHGGSRRDFLKCHWGCIIAGLNKWGTFPFYFLSSRDYLSRRSWTYRLASENHELSIFYSQWIKLCFTFSVGFMIICSDVPRMGFIYWLYTAERVTVNKFCFLSLNLTNCKVELEEELNVF